MIAYPTFARSSIAYQENGTEVAANIPRIEGNALLIEQGTANLLSENQASIETDITGFTVYNSAVPTRDTTVKWTGKASLKVVTSGSVAYEGVGAIHATTSHGPYVGQTKVIGEAGAKVEVWIRAKYSDGTYTNSGHVVITCTGEDDDWQLAKTPAIVTDTAKTLESVEILARTGAIQAVTFHIDTLQLEFNKYPTSWQPPGTSRSSEVLTAPITDAMSRVEGELTVRFYAPAYIPSSDFAIMENQLGGTENRFIVLKKLSDGNYAALLRSGSSFVSGSFTAKSESEGNTVTWTWKNGSTYSIHANGVKIAGGNYITGDLSFDNLSFGGGVVKFDELRISYKTRDDAEIIATQNSTDALTVDEKTTYYLGFNNTNLVPIYLDPSNRAIISRIHRYMTMIEWLNWAEEPIAVYTTDAADGSISVDSSRDVRRTFSLTMNNGEGLYVPNGSRTNMGVKLRISRGILTVQGAYWWVRGVFVLSDPSSSHSGADYKTSLEGSDKWALHNGDLGGTLTETTVIPAGTNIGEAIRAIAEDGGETKFAFATCTEVTPYEVTKEPGETRADLIKELALIPSWDIYYDNNGYLRFQPKVDPLNKQVVADLSVGGAFRSCYVDGKYEPRWTDLRNYFKVIGYYDSDTGEQFTGIAQNNSTDSPFNTSDPPIGIGIKAEIVEDSNITTNDLCSQRGAYELRENLRKVDRSSHSIIPLPFLLEGDCVQLEDLKNGIPDAKYEIEAIQESLGLDLMVIEVWQVVSIYEVVLSDGFEEGIGSWQQLSGGTVDIYGFDGNNCLRKTLKGDPSGGYCNLSKTTTDFELIVYTRRDALNASTNAYSVVDASGNGYGITLDYGGDLILTQRDAWAASSLGTVGHTPSLGVWYTLRLIKIGTNLTAELYSGKATEFGSPLASVELSDDTYSSFTRVAVNGGYDFYSDDIRVRKYL